MYAEIFSALKGTAADSDMGYGQQNVCFNAEYCNKPGKQAFSVILVHVIQNINHHSPGCNCKVIQVN